MYTLVAEVDLGYLLAAVFPAYLDVRGPNLYQVVDSDGRLVYGFAFTNIPRSEFVELGFPKTLSLWRLRVAPRDGGALAGSKNRQRTLDFVLIGLAMGAIVAGVVVMLAAVRREQRLSQLKSDFISNVSHELKTPLSIISMFGEMLAMGRVRSPEQAQEYAEIIRRESVRLSRLIENVLDFAKIEHGGDVYEFVDGEDLGLVVERAIDISRHRIERAELGLTLEIAEELPPTRLDANAITLALLNLVDNAIKYASDGGELYISVQAENGGVALRVRDRGTGISEEERSSVFERFYRARSVRLKPIRGSGIGLALVHHIAAAHRGEVEIEDLPEPGCSVRLWIPAQRPG